MKKKIIISTLLILTMLLNVFSIPVFAMEMIGDLEPEKVVLIGDSEKFHETIIRTDSKENQDIELKVDEDIQFTDLDCSTNIIIDQETYDDMNNSERRNISKVLKDELKNNKAISFYGDVNTLNLNNIYNILDLGKPAKMEFSDDTFIDSLKAITIHYESEQLFVDFLFDIYIDNKKQLHTVEKSEADFEKIISQSRIHDDKKNGKSTDTIKTQLKKLVSGSGKPTKYKFSHYIINGSGGKFEVYYTLEAKRKSNGDKYTVWKTTQNIITTPSGGCRTSEVQLKVEDYDDNDEKLEGYTPDSTINTTSSGSSASFSFAKNGTTSSVGISTSKSYSDIQVKPYFSRLEGVCRWNFAFTYGSNPSKYSTTCQGKTLMTNKVGAFYIKSHGFKVWIDLVVNGQYQGTVPYTFNFNSLCYPDISTK